MRNCSKQSGLTLVEILISVAIVAVLVSISLMVVPQFQEKAKEQKTREAINLLNTALEQYFEFWGDFPFEADDSNYTSISFPGNNISSMEAVYITLLRTPASRKTLSNIEPYFEKTDRTIDIDSKTYELFTIEDQWDMPLRYLYVEDQDSFPLIESAGPDKEFGDTSGSAQEQKQAQDNITNRN